MPWYKIHFTNPLSILTHKYVPHSTLLPAIALFKLPFSLKIWILWAETVFFMNGDGYVGCMLLHQPSIMPNLETVIVRRQLWVNLWIKKSTLNKYACAVFYTWEKWEKYKCLPKFLVISVRSVWLTSMLLRRVHHTHKYQKLSFQFTYYHAWLALVLNHQKNDMEWTKRHSSVQILKGSMGVFKNSI